MIDSQYTNTFKGIDICRKSGAIIALDVGSREGVLLRLLHFQHNVTMGSRAGFPCLLQTPQSLGNS